MSRLELRICDALAAPLSDRAGAESQNGCFQHTSGLTKQSARPTSLFMSWFRAKLLSCTVLGEGSCQGQVTPQQSSQDPLHNHTFWGIFIIYVSYGNLNSPGFIKSRVRVSYNPGGLLNGRGVRRPASPPASSCQTAISSLTANHRRPFWPSHLTRQPSVLQLLCCFLLHCCLLTFLS